MAQTSKPGYSVEYDPPYTGGLFLQSDARVRLIMGPIGSGKSTVCCVEIFRRCSEMPKCKDGLRRSRWVVVRNTRDQLKKTTLKTWLQWYPDGIAGKWRESEMTFHLNVGDIRAEIMFLPLDTPDDQRRLLSLEVTGVFINEAREVHPDLIIASRSRMPRYPSKAMLPEGSKDYWYGLIMDTNPPSEDSWLYDQFENVKPEGWEIYKQPGGLDPTAENKENLGPTYYEDMMAGASEEFISVHVHGNYGQSLSGKPVFRSFNPEFHVAKSALIPLKSSAHPLVIGMDFGLTPAAVIAQQDVRSRFLILDVLTSEGMGILRFVRELLKPLLSSKYNGIPVVVIGDPAGSQRAQTDERSVFDVLKSEGFRVLPARTNAIAARISAVEALLSRQVDGQGTFLVDPGCKDLIKSLRGRYRYKMKTNGELEDKPEKNGASHIADALQYACLHVDSVFGTTNHRQTKKEVKTVALTGWV